MSCTKPVSRRSSEPRSKPVWYEEPSNETDWLIVGIDVRGSVYEFNKTACEILGYSGVELRGLFYSDFILAFDNRSKADNRSIYGDPILRCLSTGESCENIVGILHCRNKRVCPIQGIVCPAYSDVSKQRRVEGAIFAAHKANVSVGQFLHKVSLQYSDKNACYMSGSHIGRALVSYIRTHPH